MNSSGSLVMLVRLNDIQFSLMGDIDLRSALQHR